MSATQGLSGAARRVADHARSLVRLEIELATSELKRKLAALGVGIGLLAAAALLAVYAVGFGLAAATAGLATELKVWQAILVMFGAVVMVTGLFAAIGVAVLRRGTSPVPEQALEEARLTTEALRNGN
jgi:hypothetical protein